MVDHVGAITRALRAGVAMLLVVAAIAVAPTPGGAAVGLSTMEFVNAIDAGAVDLEVDGVVVADDVPYGEIVDLGAVAVGSHAVRVLSSDGATVLSEGTQGLTAGLLTTLAWYPGTLGPTLEGFSGFGGSRITVLSEGPELEVQIGGDGGFSLQVSNGESVAAPDFPGTFTVRVIRVDTGAQVFPASGVVTVDTRTQPGIDSIAIGDLSDGTFEMLTRDPPEVVDTVATAMVNGLPDRTVDVSFEGVALVDDLAVGVLDDRIVLPRKDIDIGVRPDVGPAVMATLDLSGDDPVGRTIIAHLDASGDPVVTDFVDAATNCCTLGALTIRHVAATGPLTFDLSDGTVFAAMVNGEQVVHETPAAILTVTSPELPGEPPIEVTVVEGVRTFVHLIGDPGAGTFEAVVHTSPRLGAGGRFADVVGSVFEDDIAAIAAVGVTNGIRPGYFGAEEFLTRDQMAAFLVRALDLPASAVDAFADDDGTFFEDEINALAAAGITAGRSATTFAPSERITRAEMAAMLVRALAIPGSGADAFDDDDGSFFEDEINALAAAGITNGVAERMFGPDQFIQRGPAATFISRAFGLT